MIYSIYEFSCMAVRIIPAFASTQEDANRFIDELLGQRLRQEAYRFQLDGVPLDDFKFKIKKELELGILPTHRDIKANFTNGMLKGLTMLRRKAGCNPTVYVENKVTVSVRFKLYH